MVSKSTAKFIKSLQLKKYRKKEQCFLVEGAKSVLEVLKSDYRWRSLIATKSFMEEHNLEQDQNTIITSCQDLSSLGSLKSNNAAIAVVEMKIPEKFMASREEFIIALDGINDPGNLGTIVRIADWYGVKKIIASEDTADIFNTKTISASKGSFLRVEVFYTNLVDTLKNLNQVIYGAVLTGENVHTIQFSHGGILVMGNETHGISEAVMPLINVPITIPSYGAAESLNVAMATAIICDNMKRNGT